MAKKQVGGLLFPGKVRFLHQGGGWKIVLWLRVQRGLGASQYRGGWQTALFINGVDPDLCITKEDWGAVLEWRSTHQEKRGLQEEDSHHATVDVSGRPQRAAIQPTSTTGATRHGRGHTWRISVCSRATTNSAWRGANGWQSPSVTCISQPQPMP